VKRTEARGPIPWLGGLLVLYLGVPLVAFIVRFVVGPQRGFHAPGLFPALWVSIVAATISLVLITVFGLPLAYYLAHSTSKLSSAVGVVVQIPLALPPVMAGIILIYVVGPYTWLGQLFGEHLTESVTGIVIAMTFCAAPFLIVTARAAFASIDRGLLDVAKTLGHGDLSRFLRVSIPLAAPGIRAGMILSWLRAFGEYGAVVILAYNPASLPIYTYNQFSGTGLPTTLAPTALALAAAILAVALSRAKFHRPAKAPIVLTSPKAPEPTIAQPVGFDVDYRLGSFKLIVHHNPESRHLSILGASGSGKTALLRCIAGLYGTDPGKVSFGETQVETLRVEDRNVGYVAQGFSLFPHLTVWRQLMFARGASPELASYWLEHLRLTGLENRYPSELSGGQRQRVALAQALCQSPRVLLLDEPFSALDMPVRRELRRELRRLQHETDIATVIVTHDPDEAAFLSDSVIVVSNGRALQSGANRDVYARPGSPEVAGLLGIANLNQATIVTSALMDVKGFAVTIESSDLAPGTTVQWSIRPERITAAPTSSDSATSSLALTGVVSDIAEYGATTEIFVSFAADFSLELRSSESTSLRVGDACDVHLAPDAIAIWPTSVALAHEG